MRTVRSSLVPSSGDTCQRMIGSVRKRLKRRQSSSCPSWQPSALRPEEVPEDCSTDVPWELSATTQWASLLTSSPRNLVATRVPDHEVWLVDGLLTDHECRSLIAGSESHGYGPTDFVKSYRGNLRFTATDASLAEVIWQRLTPLVPAKLALQAPATWGDKHWWSSYPKSAGIWEACGLNECWRFAKYYPGDRFMCHCDFSFERVVGKEMSMLTANIYLNSGFGGGKTRFYLSDDPYFEWRSDFGKPYFEIAPKAGLCLLFRQPPGRSYWHDGEEISHGRKYLLRSDVMYRKT
mmetsp:Transcript_100571/g.313491  ORF Transcript_100571/g.313491 Transcript_100571/m.313491 type:complete len:293 (+) Transcript_100571:73-951(+)